MIESFQLQLLKLHVDLQTNLRSVGDDRKLLLHSLRLIKEAFGVADAAVAVLDDDPAELDVLFSIPRQAFWNNRLLIDYLHSRRPEIPHNTLLAPIERRRRMWAVLALRDDAIPFTSEHVRALFSIGRMLTDRIEQLDRGDVQKVRQRIERKIARRQNPKDLMYDILHGLHSLTDYDHSASLFIMSEGSLELVAEKIAWKKGKSKRIGLRLELGDEVIGQLQNSQINWYRKFEDEWLQADMQVSQQLPRLLKYASIADPDVPDEVVMICAPFTTPDDTLCVLKLSAWRPNVLADYEAQLVDEFMPLASLAVQFATQLETLHARMLQSERKSVLANVARGIAHDVNNALGAVLPLVQQLRAENEEGRLEPEVLSEDLKGIEGKIQLCRRIFESMLAIARGSIKDRASGVGNLRRAIDEALSFLRESMEKESIQVDVDLPYELPSIHVGQVALTQLFLNLCSNAKDAMPQGGNLNIQAVGGESTVQVSIQDTGVGIPARHLGKLKEPFFTTKPDGNGLGLAVCRSIIWDCGGEMDIESEVDKGTTVHLSLPVVSNGQE